MDLPDLRAKVKVDTSGIAEAEVKLAAFSETVKRELNENTGLKGFEQQAGQAFVKFGQDGEIASLRITSATARTKADLDQLERRARSFGDGLERDFRKGSNAVIKLADDGEASLARTTQQLQSTQTAATQASGGLASLGASLGSALGPLVIGVAALAVVLSPVVFLLGGFTVGVAASLTVISLAAAGIGALAAGIVVLGAATQGWLEATKDVPTAQAAVADAVNAHDKAVQALDATQKAYNATSRPTTAQDLALRQAQQAVTDSTLKLTKAQTDLNAAVIGASNPLQKLKEDAGEAAAALGQQAAPMAALLLAQLDNMIAPIQQVGSELLTWFGDRLPRYLGLTDKAMAGLTGELDRLGLVTGSFLDRVTNRAAILGPVFQGSLDIAISALDGLFRNLLRLSDWFTQRLPVLGPEVAQIMGGMGDAIQGLGTDAGRVVDWFIANWPAIVKTAQWGADALEEGFQKVQPDLDKAIQSFQSMGPVLQFVQDHADTLRPILEVVGSVLAYAAISAIACWAALVLLVAGIEAVLAAGNQINAWISSAISWFGGLAGEVSYLVGYLIGLENQLERVGEALAAVQGAGTALHALGIPGFASGGVALPGSVFRVGESGPELGYALPGGGVVIQPNAGSETPPAGQTVVQHITIAGPSVLHPSVVQELARAMSAELAWQGLTG